MVQSMTFAVICMLSLIILHPGSFSARIPGNYCFDDWKPAEDFDYVRQRPKDTSCKELHGDSFQRGDMCVLPATVVESTFGRPECQRD